MDTQRTEEEISTFSKICVEVDLNKVLPDRIILTHNNQCWTQFLDFENMAFRCRLCRETRHLQKSCPMAKKDPRKEKKPTKKPMEIPRATT